MKKLRVILASLAILAAGVGVYANSYKVATTWYRADSSTETGAHCDISLSSTPACGTTGTQCKVTVNSVQYVVSYIPDFGSCTVQPKD